MVVPGNKRDPRTIGVKALMNADEYLAFDRQCEAEGLSHSGALRFMVRQWLQLKDSTQAQLVELIKPDQFLPTPSFGARLHHGSAPACLSP